MDDGLIILTKCDDNTCCCLTLRSSAALISIISLISCFLEWAFDDTALESRCEIKEDVDTLKCVLSTLFKIANLLLLLGSIVENAVLLQIYLCSMLCYIIIGFIVAILDFCFCMRDTGLWSFVTFIPDVICLFVMFRCLPLVDSYKKRLEDM